MKLGDLRKIAQNIGQLQGPQLEQHLQEQMRALGLDPGKIYQELEMTSRYVDTHRDTSYSNDHIQLHSHSFFEILYCCNDCGAEYLVGSERYRLQPGDIILVPPGVSHRPLLPENNPKPYTRFVLWLSREFMEQYTSLFPYPFAQQEAKTNMLRTGGTQWQHLEELFQKGVFETEQAADGWEAVVIGNTITLLTLINRAAADKHAHTLKAEKPELLDQLAAYVEEHYASALTLHEISRAFYISQSTVSHLFKNRLGVSFYRYVTQRRLIAAKQLIETGMALEEVCGTCGFQDYSGFYRSFKKEYGISPRQYRTMYIST